MELKRKGDKTPSKGCRKQKTPSIGKKKALAIIVKGEMFLH